MLPQLMVNRMEIRKGIIVSIRSNKLYFKKVKDSSGEVVGYEDILFLMLQYALNCFKLPDVDLYFGEGDYCNTDLPLIAWDKKQGKEQCILYPWGQFTYAPEYRRPIHKEWKKRRNIAVFRGTPTGEGPNGTRCSDEDWQQLYRVSAVRTCHEHRDLCDTEITHIVQCSQKAAEGISSTLGVGKSLNYAQEQEYRHVLLLDGNGAPASRSAKAFAGMFTVLN